MMQQLKRSWLPVSLYVLLLAVFLLPSLSFAQQNPTLLGNTADPCIAANNCTNTDVVQSNLMTQDVLIYGAAALLFFFGFKVGMDMMLGNIRRNE